MKFENKFNNYYKKLEQEPIRLEDDPDALINYIWDDSDETLEDILYFSDDELFETWCKMPFEHGDIAMANTIFDNKSMPYRIFIIDSVIDTNMGPKYTGFLLSSQIDKSNISSNYSHNILIKNYGSIIKPNSGPTPNKDAIIKLDTIYQFDNDDFDDNAKKGKVTDEFENFITIELQKITNGLSTKNYYWNNGLPIIED